MRTEAVLVPCDDAAMLNPPASETLVHDRHCELARPRPHGPLFVTAMAKFISGQLGIHHEVGQEPPASPEICPIWDRHRPSTTAEPSSRPPAWVEPEPSSRSA